MSNPLHAGAVFGRDFRVLGELRAGGMGAVYVVEQLSTGKRRALKVMAPALAKVPTIRDRFVLEAHADARAEHDWACSPDRKSTVPASPKRDGHRGRRCA